MATMKQRKPTKEQALSAMWFEQDGFAKELEGLLALFMVQISDYTYGELNVNIERFVNLGKTRSAIRALESKDESSIKEVENDEKGLQKREFKRVYYTLRC